MKQETKQKEKNLKFKVIDTGDVQKSHEQINKGHWFDKDNKRFFKSRWSDTAYLIEELNTAFFISSEQHESYFPSYHKEPRKYTIRAVNIKTGQFVNETIYTDGKQYLIKELAFQEFYTSRDAKNALLSTDWTKYKTAFEVYDGA